MAMKKKKKKIYWEEEKNNSLIIKIKLFVLDAPLVLQFACLYIRLLPPEALHE